MKERPPSPKGSGAASPADLMPQVYDELSLFPPPEEDLGGGDFVSLQEQPATTDDVAL